MSDVEREDAEEAGASHSRRAGIDPSSGRFVGRVVAGVIDAPRFDYAAATPVLLEWLPRLRAPLAREVVARSLAHEAATSGGDVALHAMSALRRMVGNEEACPKIAAIAEHPSPKVASAARETLERIDKKLAGARP